MFEICLATALSDPEGSLLPGAAEAWPALTTRFGAIAANVTSDTHPSWIDFLDARGVAFQITPPDAEATGEQRRRALEVALSAAAPRYVVSADPVQILHWLREAPADLDRALRHVPRWDCLVIGRSACAYQTEPAGVRETDALVNRALVLLTGRQWDLAAGARGFSRHAARLVAELCDEPTAGSDIAWPLLCEIHGLSLGYLEAEGLRQCSAGQVPRHAGSCPDSDPSFWIRQMRFASQKVDAMKPFIDYYDPSRASSALDEAPRLQSVIER